MIKTLCVARNVLMLSIITKIRVGVSLTLILLISLITSILCTTRNVSGDILDIGSYSGSMCGCLREILSVGSVDDST